MALGVPKFLRTKAAARATAAADAKSAAAANIVIADLAGGADLPTTVTKVNAILAALRTAGITKAS